MNYIDALNYLYDPARVKGERSIKTGHTRTLEPMARALAQLGDPQTRYPTLHVAGSKGKGSISAMLASVLQAAGYRVGLFSSPHLHTYRERMQINGELPSEAEIVDLLTRLRPVFDAMPELITFELSTALAFTLFAERPVDVAVIEVGLGGRLDATNVIRPLVSVITALSLEHTDILGHTIEEIAGEKAGIIKPGVPVVAAPNPPAALEVIRETATVRGAPLVQVGLDVPYTVGEARPDGQWFEARRLTKDEGRQTMDEGHAPSHNGHPSSLVLRPSGWSRYWLPLLGEFQVANAVCALTAIDLVRQRGLTVSEAALRDGLAKVRWPARLEVLSRAPLVVADGAHTPESAALVVAALRRHLQFERLVLVFGALQDKDVGGMLDALLPAASQVIVARSRYPRSHTAETLAALVTERGGPLVGALDDVADGLARALSLAGPNDLILVTGSLFVAAAAREAWARLNGLPLPEMDPPLH